MPGGLGKTLVESSASHHTSKVHLTPQVSGGSDAWHKGLDVNPKMGSEKSSGMVISAEGEAFLGSNLGANAMQILESTRVAIFESSKMPRSLSGNKQVVSQGSWTNLKASHVPRPR